ncbi:unnamed protein product [Clonostachys chloroleuca]|uniref:Transcription factor domain-containing protein n=1 Tax=Clonostachys chloroleuca TaxID=1926264 RepID=A0AA35LSS5_9HYPO|nr:unnamed protein product [Clonostachys chloroleuca]
MLRWSTKHEVFDPKKANASITESTNLAHKERDTQQSEKDSLDTDKRHDTDTSSGCEIQYGDSVDPVVSNLQYDIGLNQQIFPTDDVIPIILHTSPPNVDGEAFVNVWTSEVYPTVVEQRDAEVPSGEDEEILSDCSLSHISSHDSPDNPLPETDLSQPQITNVMLETPGDDSDENTSKPASPPFGDILSPFIANDAQFFHTPSPPICHEPSGALIELVPFYFNVVCHILSTFDSEQNLFRTFVSKKWQDSSIMFYTIQSLAAAKLVWFMPEMKTRSLEFRSLALNDLQERVSAAQYWDTELLFIVLLLGVSSSWFDIGDLGIPHLEAVQHAVLNGKVQFSNDFDAIGFFRNALIYWEMVSCAVSNKVAYHAYEKMGPKETEKPGPVPPAAKHRAQQSPSRMVPHPWTGVASEPQAIFTRISRQIHALRSSTSASSMGGQNLDKPGDFLEAVRQLDQSIWAYELPKLHSISNIGDPNTPAIHHLLLAEAYMYANIYQLYRIFPNVRRKRVKWMRELIATQKPYDQTTWAASQVRSWTVMLEQEDGTEQWLRFLGRNVIIRLEQIQTNSGTSCVQALLLLVAATSLPLGSGETEEEEAAGGLEEQQQEYFVEYKHDILRARQFVLDRLEFLSMTNLSAPIQYVRNIVLEIFKRLDVGADIFWMDVLHSMGLVTIIG